MIKKGIAAGIVALLGLAVIVGISTWLLQREYQAPYRAPDGQAAAHWPQPAQTPASISTWSPAGAMAPVGHRSRQRRQPTILERECAHRSSLKLT